MGGNKALQLFVVVLPGDRPRESIKDKFITLHHRVLASSKALWHGEETKTNRRPRSIQSLRFQRKDNLKKKKKHNVSISTFQLSPECGFPLQNSNIPFSKICCKIQISRPVSKCDVGCLRSVGEAVSAEWPSWKWARICIPSVLLCIFHENANLHFFSQNKKKTFAFILGQVLYNKCSNLHI